MLQVSPRISKVSLTEESLKDAIQEITRLSPKPGSAWQGTIYEKQGATIIPDFYVENRDGELVVILNHGDIPYLRISQDYKNMLEDYSKGKEKQSAQMKEATLFVKQKIDSAKWFIDAIKQRNETLLKTMKAIVETQKEFFYEGDESYLKPMILQVIADKTCYDVSTISRVSNSKYVQTEFGIYPLKFFFSESMARASPSASPNTLVTSRKIIPGSGKSGILIT